MKESLPRRKRNRLESADYRSCGVYFITVCTVNRRCLLGKTTVGAATGRPQGGGLSPYGEIVDEAIGNISSVYPTVSVDDYVIMPNHIHLLLRIRADECGRPVAAPTMSRVINQLKGYVSKRAGMAIWQKSFYDHIIRDREDYEAHLRYIDENPLRWDQDELYTGE